MPDQNGMQIGVQELGDRVYVYPTTMEPASGQWVQVFSKDPAESLEDAIRRQVLARYAPEDCQVVKSGDPVAGQQNPPSFVFARVQVPTTPADTMETLVQKAAKCPQPYAAVGGLAYFLADTDYPDRFVFYSIGQYGILAGPGRPWQSSLRFINGGAVAEATEEPTRGAGPTAGQALGSSAGAYVDDRSTADSVMRAYVNALNRREFTRAYAYWESPTGGEPGAPGAFESFRDGYADTTSVTLSMGTIQSGAAAGNRFWQVPVTLLARTRAGELQTFVGCYTLHLASPDLQAQPPFESLAIRSAEVQQVDNSINTAEAMANACDPGAGESMPTPAPVDPGEIRPERYLDDRSNGVQVIRSLFNAINRREYARAYGYWDPGQPADEPGPFPEFEQGYAGTESVELTTGQVIADITDEGIGYSVPVTLRAQTTEGPQTFVGCYHLGLANPGEQVTPPFRPLSIVSSEVRGVTGDTEAGAQMATICDPGGE
jgi:hypothetical protein